MIKPQMIKVCCLGLLLCLNNGVYGQTVAEAGSVIDFQRRFASLALDCIQKEYPNKISHVLASTEDVQAPMALTPVFYGCYDWHSAVHGHWLLVRLLRLNSEAEFASRTRAAMEYNFAAENVAGEVRYVSAEGRGSFERPYRIAWFLQLMTELREWQDPQAQEWLQRFQPLEALLVDRIGQWQDKLMYPIRVGEHSQTAFAFALIADWATGADDTFLATKLRNL